LQYDCALLRAQIDLIRNDPGLISSQGEFTNHLSMIDFLTLYFKDLLIPPALIVMRLANMDFYEKALKTARALEVDTTDVFTKLVVHCLRLSRSSEGSA
jgi:nuclear pore complex protein Nup160